MDTIWENSFLINLTVCDFLSLVVKNNLSDSSCWGVFFILAYATLNSSDDGGSVQEVACPPFGE